MIWVPFPVWQDFSILYSVQAESGAHPIYYPMGTDDFSPEVKLPGRGADYLYLSSVEAKNVGAIPPLPHMFYVIVLN
jgi:hypothetical protein